MDLMKKIRDFFKPEGRKPVYGGLDILKYIGPGLLVTVGFIDPGNWASNIAAGSDYGYLLLWMVTLSTLMLIFLQHNAAHLGIATGLCLSEAASIHLPKAASRLILSTSMLAAAATALAEILGSAIALRMIFHIPLQAGAVLTTIFIIIMLLTNTYSKIERWIIAFVSIIGLSFIYELTLVQIPWIEAGKAWITPSFPEHSLPVIMSVLGAVVMPHNLFLHSEIIQSRQWNLKEDAVIKKQLSFEFLDTLFSMGVGWAINSAMILVAAAVFFQQGILVTELEQAEQMLRPLLGNHAAFIFAIALLFSGLSSSITAGMAGGSIFAGMFREPFEIKDRHSVTGVLITLLSGLAVIFLIRDPFKGLVYSQMALSVQLPITIFLQIYLTSSKKVMGKYANTAFTNTALLLTGAVVTGLNIALFISFIK